MSLLPGRILPQTEPLGTLSEDGKTVIMDKNWWLWAYNVSLQSIGTGTGIPADQLIDLESVDIDSVGTDIAAANSRIAALANLIPTEGDPVPSLQDVRNALLLAYSALDAVDAIVSSFSTPSAKVGLTAVAGSAQTAMRSDAAPAIDQALAPTWTGQHIFTKTFSFGGSAPVEPISFESTAPGFSMVNTGAGVDGKAWEFGVTTNTYTMNLSNDAGSVARNIFVVTRTANAVTGMTYGNTTDKPPHTFNGAVGVNGNSPPAQVTGWGVPTGPAVVANFPGATATLVQCSNAIAQIIKDLKALGPYGA